MDDSRKRSNACWNARKLGWINFWFLIVDQFTSQIQDGRTIILRNEKGSNTWSQVKWSLSSCYCWWGFRCKRSHLHKNTCFLSRCKIRWKFWILIKDPFEMEFNMLYLWRIRLICWTNSQLTLSCSSRY